MFILCQLSLGHRITILKSMEAVVHEKVEDIDVTLAVDIIKQASVELTQTKVCHLKMLKMRVQCTRAKDCLRGKHVLSY